MKFSSDFSKAVVDYFILLQKKYPQKAILKLVGDRYKLTGVERSIMYRGISTESENISRKEIFLKELPSGKTLAADSFNQILTIASYLNGNIVFISTDGILRDASEMHGKIFRTELLDRSINLIFEYCKSLELKQIAFYIDQQVNYHEKLNNSLSRIISTSQIISSDQVDNALVNLSSGIIATSDSQIIDKTKLKIFDLSFQTLKFHFNPHFLDLSNFIYKKS